MNYYQTLLHKNGYLKIRSSLSADEISRMKERLCELSKNQRVRQVSDLITDPDIQRILNDKNLKAVLHKLYDSPVFYPNLQTQFNSFTQKISFKRRFGLHIDGANELASRNDEFKEQIPTWTNVGFYFQDAHNSGYGGGICGSVPLFKLVRSLFRLPFGFQIAEIVLKVAKKISPDFLLPVIKTNAGDFVIFDNRFPHASSVGPKIMQSLKTNQNTKQTFLQNIPKENNKLVLYAFSGEQKHVDKVMKYNFLPSVKENVEKGDFDYREVVQFCVNQHNKDYGIPFVSGILAEGDG